MGSMNEVIDMERPTTGGEVAAPAPQHLAAAPRQVATTAFELVAQAAARGASMEELKAFIDLQERLEANEARKAFTAAMAAFKRNAPSIYKDKNVSHSGISYDHATLGAVCDAVIAELAEHGISHDWDTDQPDSGMIVVKCTLTHLLGHSKSTTLQAPPDNSGKKNGIQQIGSTVTYLQRYTLLGACGLATKDAQDNDGRNYSEPEPQPAQRSAPEPSPELIAQAKAAASAGLAAYQKFWSATGAPNRKALASYHDGWKASASTADQARAANSEPLAGATKPLSADMQALLADLTADADAGTDFFNEVWGRLSPATQDCLVNEYPKLKARAEAAGAGK